MTRYLLVTDFKGGVVDSPMSEWKPDLAKIVTADGRAAPVVTDGPFQEFKEWLSPSTASSSR